MLTPNVLAPAPVSLQRCRTNPSRRENERRRTEVRGPLSRVRGTDSAAPRGVAAAVAYVAAFAVHAPNSLHRARVER